MKILFSVLKILFSVIAIGFIVSKLNFNIISQHILSFSSSLIIILILLMLIQVFLGAWRWYLVLKRMGEDISFYKIFQLFYIFLFFNVCLPLSAAAEITRIWFIKRQGLSTSNAIGSVVIDRLFGVLILLFLNILVTPFIFIKFGNSILFFMSLTLSILSIISFCIFILLDKLPNLFNKTQFFRILITTKNKFVSLFSFKTRACQLILLVTFIAFFLQSVIIYILADRLKLSLSITDCIFFVPPVIFISSLPISVAGWGLREGAMVFALTTFNIPMEQALILSILLGLLWTVIGIPGSLFWTTLKKENNNSELQKSIPLF